MIKKRSHLIIPDTQVRPGVKTDHFEWIGNYIAEKRPDVVVHLGDLNDMKSLCSYDVGKASSENQRYRADIEAGLAANEKLMTPISKVTGYNPRMVLTLGNHEQRIQTETEHNPKFIGTLSIADLGYESAGWEVHPFLRPVKIDGIQYAHYFVSGVLGRPVTSAAALLRERAGSAVMGHVQKFDLAVHPRTQSMAIFAGICYLHDERYLGPQGQNTRRQIIMLHEVYKGRFDPMFVSLDYLKRAYS